MMKKRRLLSAILLLFGVTLLQAGSVTVAVAANVSYAIHDLVKVFEKEYPPIKIRTILGSTGKLTAQIEHGAPYDVFMAADMAYPEMLYRRKVAGKPEVYAKGALALLSPKPKNLTDGLKILRTPRIRRIAVANPKTAPYGKAAVEALKHAGLYEIVRNRLIYGESVSQTLTYTLRAADIGIVAKSSLFSPKLRHFQKGKNWVEVTPSFYTPIKQGIVLLKRARNNVDAKTFYNFILSPKARAVFKAYGYLQP